jgi:cytosine/adenosine deaminase-related metal-dependent hydrolase
MFLLRARYIFPIAGDPIPDGLLAVAGDRIAWVGAWNSGLRRGVQAAPEARSSEVRDLGNAAILPGLVNAHCHLDFSDLTAPLGHRGISLPDWIRRALAYRGPAPDGRQAVARGLRESIRCGVTLLADIVQPWGAGVPPALTAGGRDAWATTPSVTALIELIAPTAARVAGAIELARTHLRARRPEAEGSRRQAGLAPHAPYTVHPDLLKAVVEISAAERVPVAMHLAESEEELELLRHGRGPMRGLLEELGAWDAAAIPPGHRATIPLFPPGPARPIDYLRLLVKADRALVIHGNYLDDEERSLLAAHAARAAVVYCPRSHDWFAHRAYPLQKMLDAGVVVALGTDGRGSSPDLSILAEMRFAAASHSGIRGDRILMMGTLAGARALGRERDAGSLAPGKRADLAVVALPDRDAADPHDLLLRSDEPVVACYCGGVEVDVPSPVAEG